VQKRLQRRWKYCRRAAASVSFRHGAASAARRGTPVAEPLAGGALPRVSFFHLSRLSFPRVFATDPKRNKEIDMNTRTTLIAAMTAALAVSGSALAAGVGGGSSENGATGGGAAANGVYPAPTQGVEQGVPANGDTSGAHRKHPRKHMRHHAQKPANDTTNMPGADASSDTKGQ